MAVHTVLVQSEHDRLGAGHRVGLRYINVVRARGGKDLRFYLRPASTECRTNRSSLADPSFTPRAEAAPWPAEIPVRWSTSFGTTSSPWTHPRKLPELARRRVAAAGSRGRCAELPAKGGGRGVGHPDRHGPLRRGELRCRSRLGGGAGLRTARSHHRDIPQSCGHRRRDRGVEMRTGRARGDGWGTTPRASGDFLAAAVRSSPPLQLDRDPSRESVRSSRLPPLERPARPREHRTSRPIPRTEPDPLL